MSQIPFRAVWAFVLTGLIAVICGRSASAASPQHREAEALHVAVAQSEELLADRKPSESLNLDDLPQAVISFELLRPDDNLPQTDRFPYAPLAALFRYAQTCERPLHAESALQWPHALQKALNWHEYLCKEKRTLPADFFSAPPFLHPSGASFVALAWLSGLPEFHNRAWLEAHVAYLHVLELRLALEAGVTLTPLQRVLVSMKPAVLSQLVMGQTLVLGDRALYVRQPQNGDEALKLRFAVYPRELWDQITASLGVTSYAPSPAGCAFEKDGLCWRAEDSVGRNQLYFRLVFALSLTLAAVLLYGGFRRFRAASRERADRAFIVQMLTHELRTPAASMQLDLESFRQSYDSLPAEVQTGFLRMCEAIQRLRRIIDASGQYLRSQKGRRAMRFNGKSLASLNDYLAAILEPYGDAIQFRPMEHDVAVVIDAYWFGTCVRNLVENALKHGQAPVLVTAAVQKSWLGQQNLAVSVEDQGSWNGLQKSQRTAGGLGLGLAIVRQTMKGMGGKMSIKRRPTTCTLILRRPRFETACRG